MLKDIMTSIRVTSYPKRWEDLYEKASARVENGLPQLQEAWLTELSDEYHLFEQERDYLLEMASLIRNNPALSLYVALIEECTDNFNENMRQMVQASAAEGEDDRPYRAAPTFAMLPSIPGICAEYRRHGVPEELIAQNNAAFERLHGIEHVNLCYMAEHIEARFVPLATMNFELLYRLNNNIKVFQNRAGETKILLDGMKIHRSGLAFGCENCTDEEGSFFGSIVEDEHSWTGHPVDDDGHGCRETVRLEKDEWRVVLTKDDPVIMIHIPEGGLKPDEVTNSLAVAKAFFAEHYPEYPAKALVTCSWLLDPQLRDMLPDTSRIIQFQNRFRHFPNISHGDAPFFFVFTGKYDSYNDLPENTSLERALKKHYLSGKCIYELYGILL